ncbi:hypothetical protein Scep_030298 [Stephania cephalantha]|uniref:GRF-type domain-containing protein n=1 Tax=Stephania cephalantha TaxID=152367 RepID=A0AAP0E2W7_9MAGN
MGGPHTDKMKATVTCYSAHHYTKHSSSRADVLSSLLRMVWTLLCPRPEALHTPSICLILYSTPHLEDQRKQGIPDLEDQGKKPRYQGKTMTGEKRYWECGSKYYFVDDCIWNERCSKYAIGFCVIRRVTKEGPNKGKFFYGCTNGFPNGPCKFFVWTDLYAPRLAMTYALTSVLNQVNCGEDVCVVTTTCTFETVSGRQRI